MNGWSRQVPFILLAAGLFLCAVDMTRADVIEVQVDDHVFEPRFVIINRGDTVRWVWVRGVHSTTSYDGSWDSGLIGPGSQFEYTFNGTGQFDYYCSIHVDCCDMVGTVYVLDNGEFLGVVVDNLTQPNGLLFDTAGNLYVSSFGDTSIVRFDGSSQSTLVAAAEGGLTGPSGLEMGPGGNLYVADLVAGAIRVYDSRTGESLGDFIPPGGDLRNQSPSDLLFDQRGQLLVANLGNSYWVPTGSVKAFDANSGELLSDFATGILGASRLVLTPQR
jgi:plastocyanin/sugar lactone lactonase YvrE